MNIRKLLGSNAEKVTINGRVTELEHARGINYARVEKDIYATDRMDSQVVHIYRSGAPWSRL